MNKVRLRLVMYPDAGQMMPVMMCLVQGQAASQCQLLWLFVPLGVNEHQ